MASSRMLLGKILDDSLLYREHTGIMANMFRTRGAWSLRTDSERSRVAGTRVDVHPSRAKYRRTSLFLFAKDLG